MEDNNLKVNICRILNKFQYVFEEMPYTDGINVTFPSPRHLNSLFAKRIIKFDNFFWKKHELDYLSPCEQCNIEIYFSDDGKGFEISANLTNEELPLEAQILAPQYVMILNLAAYTERHPGFFGYDEISNKVVYKLFSNCSDQEIDIDDLESTIDHAFEVFLTYKNFLDKNWQSMLPALEFRNELFSMLNLIEYVIADYTDPTPIEGSFYHGQEQLARREKIAKESLISYGEYLHKVIPNDKILTLTQSMTPTQIFQIGFGTQENPQKFSVRLFVNYIDRLCLDSRILLKNVKYSHGQMEKLAMPINFLNGLMQNGRYVFDHDNYLALRYDIPIYQAELTTDLLWRAVDIPLSSVERHIDWFTPEKVDHEDFDYNIRVNILTYLIDYSLYSYDRKTAIDILNGRSVISSNCISGEDSKNDLTVEVIADQEEQILNIYHYFNMRPFADEQRIEKALKEINNGVLEGELKGIESLPENSELIYDSEGYTYKEVVRLSVPKVDMHIMRSIISEFRVNIKHARACISVIEGRDFEIYL